MLKSSGGRLSTLMMFLKPIKKVVFSHTKSDLFQKPASVSGLSGEFPTLPLKLPYFGISSSVTKQTFNTAMAICSATKAVSSSRRTYDRACATLKSIVMDKNALRKDDDLGERRCSMNRIVSTEIIEMRDRTAAAIAVDDPYLGAPVATRAMFAISIATRPIAVV